MRNSTQFQTRMPQALKDAILARDNSSAWVRAILRAAIELDLEATTDGTLLGPDGQVWRPDPQRRLPI